MSDSTLIDPTLDNLSIEEWRKRYLEMSKQMGARANLEEPGIGTKISEAFGEFGRTTAESAPLFIAELLDEMPLGTMGRDVVSVGDAVRIKAARELIPNFEELSPEDQTSQLNEALPAKNGRGVYL